MENFKIDRNQIIGFVLIGLIMLWFAWWSTNNAPQKPAQQEQTTEQPAAATPTLPTAAEALDTLQRTTTDTSATGAVVNDSTFVIENDRIRMAISSKGALITRVFLKKFQTWDSLPLNLIDSNQIMAFRAGDEASSIALNYTGTVQTTAEGQTLVLQSVESNKPKFKFTYALPAESYLVQLNVEATGLTKTGNHLFIDWQLDALRTEKSVSQERQKATIYFAEPEDEYDYLSVRGDDEDEKQNLRWIGYKQHFFSTILEPGIPITNSRMAISQFEGETLTKRMKSENDLGQIGSSFSLPVTLFFGPNKYEILKSYDKGYQNVIDFGWGIFGWIGKGVVIPIFNWLEDYGMNYGIIIFIMALIIKIVLFPLTYTSYKSMAKMKVLKPEMDAIAEKFKDKDPVKKNQATMELYQQAGVNPLGGCIPVLVQMPILLAMFNFFPASIELRQQPFLWAEDLSSFDAIVSWQAHIPLLSEYYGNHISLFTVLMTISTLIYTWMNSQMQGNTNQIPGMKYIMYGMPIMLLFWFNSYSAGLSYYYFLANVITFSQQWLIRKTIDEDAIHAKIQEKRANPKQKSKFAERLEAAQKQAKAKR